MKLQSASRVRTGKISSLALLQSFGTVGYGLDNAIDVTPFFRSESYESRLAASVSWQEDCEHHDEKEEKAFA